MVGTDTYRRNDDGTYSSEYGHTVSKAPNGSLWVGGAPTGYRDIGFGVQLTPSEWVPSSLQPPAPYKPQTYAPPVQYAYGDSYSGRVSSADPGSGSFLGLAIYPWMLLLALAAYAGRLQCIIGTQIYGSGEADIPTMTSDWVIADI